MFCRHLRETRMTYGQHAFRALKFGGWACKMAIVCFVHSICPFWLGDTFSQNVLELADHFRNEGITK
jgi:hypothetical protein